MEPAGLDPAAVALSARFGGGPGGSAALDDLRQRRAAVAAEVAERVGRWRRAEIDLAAAVAELTAAEPAAVLARAGQTG